MLEMREQSAYLKDFDYKKVMEEAIHFLKIIAKNP